MLLQSQDPVREVREVAQIVLEGADEAVVRVVGQRAVQVRVEVQLQPNSSAGILEWKLD